MLKKLAPLFILIVLSLVLSLGVSACSSTQSASLSGTTSDSVESKLGYGILQLEGTSLSITVSQAESTLILWKAVSTLSKELSTANAEMDGLYAQIKESLTPEQISAIQQMDISQDLSDMLQNSSQSATKITQTKTSGSTSSMGSAPMGGGAPMDGGVGGGAGGGGSADMMIGQSTTAKSTSSTQTSAQSSLDTDANIILADTVVSLLKSKIAG